MKHTFFILVLFLSSIVSFAQEQPVEDKKGFQKERIFIGGNFGLTFGDYTLINVSPQVGYRFNNYLAAGLGINAQYINEKIYSYGQEIGKIKRGVTGLNVFGRIYPIDQIMIQVQPEANYIFGSDTFYGRNPETTKRDATIVPSLLLGGGVVVPSGKGSFIASIFYDVLQNSNSPYGARPIYNFGYNISL